MPHTFTDFYYKSHYNSDHVAITRREISEIMNYIDTDQEVFVCGISIVQICRIK